jgi:hypothetical protein
MCYTSGTTGNQRLRCTATGPTHHTAFAVWLRCLINVIPPDSILPVVPMFSRQRLGHLCSASTGSKLVFHWRPAMDGKSIYR